VRYYEGTPLPTSLLNGALLGVAWWQGATGDAVWLGRWQVGPAGFHPLVLVYLASGVLMVSRVRIPKP
jgi:CDP-diacylglycerol--serine O-phosphatidyltransferase